MQAAIFQKNGEGPVINAPLCRFFGSWRFWFSLGDAYE